MPQGLPGPGPAPHPGLAAHSFHGDHGDVGTAGLPRRPRAREAGSQGEAAPPCLRPPCRACLSFVRAHGHGLHLGEVKAGPVVHPDSSPGLRPPPRRPQPGVALCRVGWVGVPLPALLNNLWSWASLACRPQQPLVGLLLALPRCRLGDSSSVPVCNACC